MIPFKAYWSTHKSIETPFLPSVMSFERYELQCILYIFWIIVHLMVQIAKVTPH